MVVLSHHVNAESVVLIVEDNARHAESFQKLCQQLGFRLANIHFEKLITTAREQARAFGAHLVILDLALKENPNDPSQAVVEIEKWQGELAVIVVSNFREAVFDAAPCYAAIKKPSRSETDQARFEDQLKLAIRSALALRSANQGLLDRLRQKFFLSRKGNGRVKRGKGWEWRLKIPGLPIDFAVPILSIPGVLILIGAIAVTMWFFVFRHK